MYKQKIVIQNEDNKGAIRRALLQTASGSNYDVMTVAVAYATTAGCQMVIEDFKSKVANWRRIQKQWLISFDFGITEPTALASLASLPNSVVKISNAQKVLLSKLRPSRRFHHKLYLFTGDKQNSSFGLFSGSANLTPSGLMKNSEQGVSQVWIPPFSPRDTRLLRNAYIQKTILQNEFNQAVPLTQQLLDSYVQARARTKTVYYDDDPSMVQNITNPQLGLTISKAAAILTSNFFWVEVGTVVKNLGELREGNQIDLQKGSRLFFGFGSNTVPKNTQLGVVQIKYGGIITDCHMRFGNNQMDKLTLPIPGAGGPRTYENKTLLFTREPNNVFELTIGTATDIAGWKRNSTVNGSLYTMKKGREFGVF